jgi:hypothetical protein
MATEILKDSTSHSPFFELVDSTTGLPKTGIVYTDVTGSYCRSRGARVAITMASLASASAAYSSGGFILVDDANQPGVCRFDVPNAAFAAGAEEVVVTIKATGCRTVSRAFTLTDISMQTATIPVDSAAIVAAVLAGVVDTGVSVAKALEILAALAAGKVSASSAAGVTTLTYRKRDGTSTSFTVVVTEADKTRATTGSLV